MTFLLRAKMLAMTEPKFPAPMTPTGLSDELLKVISHEPVVIVVQDVQILRDDVAFPVFQQRPLKMKYADIVKPTPDDDVDFSFQVRGVVDHILVLHQVDLLSHTS